MQQLCAAPRAPTCCAGDWANSGGRRHCRCGHASCDKAAVQAHHDRMHFACLESEALEGR
jgi:hypothetical protein